MWIRAAALAALVSSLASSVPAQAPAKLPGFLAWVKGSVSPAKLKPGSTATLSVTIALAPGFHIYDPKPGDEFAIASALTPKKTPGLTFGKASWPTPTVHEKARIHEGTITVTVPVTLAKTVKPGVLKLNAALYAQACNETGCLPPETVTLSVPLAVGK